MSEYLLKTSEISNNIAMIFCFFLIIAAITAIVYALVDAYFSKKKRGYYESKSKVRDRYDKQMDNMSDLFDFEVKGQAEYKNKIKEQKEEEIKNIEILEDNLENKETKFKEFIRTIGLILTLLCIGTYMIFVLVYSNVGGSISDIKKVDNVCNNDVCVTAYYDIKYDNVEQKTVTMFVKNNSNKTLNNARIKEKNSGEISYIDYLEPNQEKIVSFNVYSYSNDDYEFEIEDVEFKE